MERFVPLGLLAGLACLTAACATAPEPLRACPDRAAVDYYFPTTISFYSPPRPNSFFRHEWYSQDLARLGEESLTCGTRAAEVYRFIWLRSFDPPVTVTVTVTPNGAEVVGKKGIFGLYRDYVRDMELHPNQPPEPRKIIRVEQSRRLLSVAELAAFREALAQMDFWAMETPEPPWLPGEVRFDGTEWLLEGGEGPRYHVVDRWEAGTQEFRDLGDLLLEVSGLEFPDDERTGSAE